jgi:hypothetical protein
MKPAGLLMIFLLTFQLAGNGQSIDQNINGLKFSKAFFISMSVDKLRDFVAIDTTIKVPKGRVWNVTAVKAFMVNDDWNPYENEISLWVNDQIIYYYKSQFDCPLWLPEGDYRIRLMSYLKSKNLNFKAYLSGVEYSIEH